MEDRRALHHHHLDLGDSRSGSGIPRAAALLCARLRAGLSRLCRDEGGQGIVEYIIILSATVVGAGLISRQILRALDSGIVKLGGQLEKDLKTGRASVSIWEN